MSYSHSTNSWEVVSFPVGPLQCNCSLLWDKTTKEAIVIDPGDEAPKILAALKKQNLRLKTILHTHAHFDHIGASKVVHESTSGALFLHSEDRFLWENMAMQGKLFGFPLEPIGHDFSSLEDEMEFQIGKEKLKALHTPGHTPGSCSFVIGDLLFSGDTLFKNSVGRTDLWKGDFDLLSTSIKKKLYSLDDDTKIICGHGPITSIGHEKRSNPFVSL